MHPVEILSEFDSAGWERRKVELFADGSFGFASRSESMGGSELALIPCPPDSDVVDEREFQISELSQVEFEAAWSRARQALATAV